MNRIFINTIGISGPPVQDKKLYIKSRSNSKRRVMTDQHEQDAISSAKLKKMSMGDDMLGLSKSRASFLVRSIANKVIDLSKQKYRISTGKSRAAIDH